LYKVIVETCGGLLGLRYTKVELETNSRLLVREKHARRKVRVWKVGEYTPPPAPGRGKISVDAIWWGNTKREAEKWKKMLKRMEKEKRKKEVEKIR
jgi:hypothetical protein